jgi:hypothetical protein
MGAAVLLGALSVTSQSDAATGTGVDFASDVPVASFQASRTYDDGTDRSSGPMVFQAPNRAYQAVKFSGTTSTEFYIEKKGMDLVGQGSRRGIVSGVIGRRQFPAAPDGFRLFDMSQPFHNAAGSMLADHRAGTTVLAIDVVGGVSLLKGTAAVAANECGGLAAGTMTIWFDQTTLLPVKIAVVRGSFTQTFTFAYSSINRRFASSVFAFIPARRRRTLEQSSDGFKRATVAKTDAMVPWRLKLPTSLPAGYSRAVLGYAPRSGRVGPEASIAPVRGYSAAVYSRGVERIEVTARRATSTAAREWRDSDPFAGECADITIGDATVGGKPARFGQGPQFMPHLYWRDGGALYTVSGPFPKTELVRIAESFQNA